MVEMQVRKARAEYVRWLHVTRDLSPHTIRAYDGDIAAFERYLGEHASVGEIDQRRLLTFIEEQRAAGLSAKSIRRRASGLRGFCRWLQSVEQQLDEDPWAGASVAVGRARSLPRVVPTDQLDRLLASLRLAAGVGADVEPDRALRRPHASTTLLAVALMVATGVRVNEVVSIEVPNVDVASRTLRIVGKGRRERLVFLSNDWIADLVSAYLVTRAEIDPTHDRLLFNLSHGELTPAAMRVRLDKAARAAGIRLRVTPHMLRHTAATQLIEAGVDIRYIQRLLGHASLSTTEIYTHVSDWALKRVVTDADVLGKAIQMR